MDDVSEMGPVDYILVEWPGRQPNGEVAPHLVDLVDRGLIRILDLAFIAKDEDGTVAGHRARRPRRRRRGARGLRGRLLGPALRRRLDRGRRRAGARHLGRAARLREHLGRPLRRRGPPLRRPARRQRPHPRPSHPRRARRGRGRTREEQQMPGLLRGVARTAVIAGTATSVSNRVSKRQGERWAQQEEQQQAAAPPPPAPAAPARGRGARRSSS